MASLTMRALFKKASAIGATSDMFDPAFRSFGAFALPRHERIMPDLLARPPNIGHDL
jgi:hypothetical protein